MLQHTQTFWKGGLILGPLILILTNLPSSAEDAGALYNTPYDVSLGERYFERQCSRCHGFDAKGNDETGAPDLTGRLNRASNEVGIFNVIRNGVPGTAMLPVDAALPDTQVWQLVSYIESLRYDPNLVQLDGSPDSGLALFQGKGECSSCYMVMGQGGRLGPDLSRVGESTRPEDLMVAITNPHEDVDPRWWTLEVTGPDGVTRSGFRMGEDSFSVRIMDNDSNLWSYQKNNIESIHRVERSTMPSYDESMSETELDDLVAYLFSLRREEK